MRIHEILLKLLCLAMLGVVLVGCALFDKEEKQIPTETLYKNAKENLDDGNWQTAIAELKQVKGQSAYGEYAEQAQLDIAFAHYRAGERDAAVAAADEFIKEHPTHQAVDYALYLKALALYQQNDSTLGKLIGRDDLSDRDAEITRNALNAFTDLVQLFPDSKYAPDSRVRVNRLTEALARHEVIVAAYYFARNANVAVVNRAKGVVENYSDTAAVEESLALLVFAYQNMGLGDLAKDSQRVLELNFPKSAYLGKNGRAALDASLQKIAPDAVKK